MCNYCKKTKSSLEVKDLLQMVFSCAFLENYLYSEISRVDYDSYDFRARRRSNLHIYFETAYSLLGSEIWCYDYYVEYLAIVALAYMLFFGGFWVRQLDFRRRTWKAPSLIGHLIQREIPSRRILPRHQLNSVADNSWPRIADTAKLRHWITDVVHGRHHLLFATFHQLSFFCRRSLAICYNGRFHLGESSLASR